MKKLLPNTCCSSVPAVEITLVPTVVKVTFIEPFSLKFVNVKVSVFRFVGLDEVHGKAAIRSDNPLLKLPLASIIEKLLQQ